MKYFIDTEFIEGFHKPIFGKKRHFIDLISIGIVAEDGRKYYAISNEYNYNDADDWVKENVLLPLYRNSLSGDIKNSVDVGNFQSLVGLPNERIAEEVLLFIGDATPEIYGYYSDYDWVLFCSLFGRMIDLPKRFPMYCNDLKQTVDEYAIKKVLPNIILSNAGGKVDKSFDGYQHTLGGAVSCLKNFEDYPKQENEHNALEDAKWNMKLYEFLQTI